MAAAKSKIAAAKKIAAKLKGKKKSYSPQHAPQSKSYREINDKMVSAKPVGWRWTKLGANKLGKNENVRPNSSDIEKYKGEVFKLKGIEHRFIYSEKRVDKSDKSYSSKFADGGTTDGAGSFKSGGSIKQSLPQSKSYRKSNDMKIAAKPVGWRYVGSRTDEPSQRVISREIKKPREDRSVYFEKRRDKSDYSRERKFADGGTTDGAGSFKSGGKVFGGRQYNPYNEGMDAEKTAKPIGWRYTDRLAKRLGKNEDSRPSVADVEKYAGRGVYYENRQDKSDATPSKKYKSLADGGTTDGAGSFAMGGVERIANTSARDYSENLIPFRGNNLEGKILDNGDYVVLSYGWFPLWYFCKSEEKWYGNSTKYSVSTSVQISQSRPTYDAIMLSKNDLGDLMMNKSQKFEDGGLLDGLLANTNTGYSTTVGGTSFSNVDLTPQMDIVNPSF